MKTFFKSSASLLLLIVLSISLVSCSSGITAGLEAFQSNDGRYGFFYPTGWTRITLKGGPEVVFHDLINSDETLSLVISDISADVELENMGSPSEVGEKLMNNLLAPNGGEREAELLDAKSRVADNHTFYDIEYLIHLPDKDRHELATVVVDRGSLYTFAAGTNDSRWNTVGDLFERVISSFVFLI
ncbi:MULTISPECIES: photosystem II reaction center PsbP [Prochlorococcus]|uniref:Photosystem II protein P PsbP n=1 Tax=Prochlorococcus marinus (strain SARG / CCMP1375 / SS120) TaxID=167539 RepID=Q7VBJ5_PROMA|nr:MULTISPECIES: photosystem II reaction center PsbP [Prochlorococcus]AAQ00142.1 Photosystem II protein P PsbP [Prochlorococcus marinus subsp. marinus str. CCMP1375]KGG13938.1 Photosystem II oxygen evolving complex protein PsbP [Prochlorococcus marinus str. LG]KGG19071.1 Photosystem II oxygen evolving complex protein PsbP [Prochlorococcus marinus str. SS2]KGG23389.1 Photosystem II oxygen evolving complex protein PsbP [Prochlorococcus marinus str. SS35]KGG32375.1 Photosystem II oxygen evolving 